jgi:glycosyltransferase involved in cell wall biosynthesis
MNRVDLIWLSQSSEGPFWPLGEVWPTEPTPRAVDKRIQEQLPRSNAEAWLFWDCTLGSPNAERVEQMLSQTADLWHVGLRLGMNGLPGLTDFVNPTWMLNCDPDQMIEASSWRLSLRACLVRATALRQLGGPRKEFEKLEGASLEMGHRYVTRGAITRHIPSLLPESMVASAPSLTLQDELRFTRYRFGSFWSNLALLRAVISGYAPFGQAVRAWQVVRRETRHVEPSPLDHGKLAPISRGEHRVSVLIPTLDRYPYLRTLLAQLRQQTVRPIEIIIVDQTARQQRDSKLAIEFADLPLEIIYLDEPGQCSSRNEGLRLARGDYVLFVDDDDEVPPSLIADHLTNLARFRADVSSGVADEVGAATLPPSCPFARVSDVFPTNNTLVRREVLQRSGLFDLAYERGQRADGDLGMRVYLSGALMLLDPDVSVLHHHAPSGGLRTHKARVITYASSRQRIRHRQLPSATEIYLARRYFTARQVRETIWLGILGTFSIRGSVVRKMLKFVAGMIYLPNTLWRVSQERRQAERMLQRFPEIPGLEIGIASQDYGVRDYADSRVSVAVLQ